MAQSIGVILQQWAEMDIFYYALPFLLIFALVFAILQKVNIMGDAEGGKRVNAVIAIAVALLSLQYDYVPVFFSILFPKLGIGLAILLVALIMIGLFADYTKKTGAMYLFMGIGGVTAGLVVLNSLSDYSWWTGSFWQQNMSAIIAGIIIIGFVVAVITSGKTHGEVGLFERDIGSTHGAAPKGTT